MAVKDQWQLDGQTGEPVNAERTWAREFRYAGSGRQRYLTRARDPATLLPASAADGLWSDYDGEGVYGDFAVDVGTGTAEGSTLAQYEPGLWQRDAADPQAPLDYYFHGDLIGSTRAMSDGEGSAVQRVIYTAFGERVYASGGAGVPPASRYGYAGAWGYEGGGVWGDGNELPWLHVGERLYDPATGRFLQRDPIGIRGGLNTYVHTANLPTMAADPDGKLFWVAAIVAAALIIDAVADNAWAPEPRLTDLDIETGNAYNEVDKIVGVGCVALSFLLFPPMATSSAGVRFTPDQSALIDLAKGASARGGVTREEARILREWACEYGVPFRGPELHPGRPFGQFPHIHIGPVNHIPVR
ncbi:MAG: RHS repeat-associated core domain-containing protein [Phycisphaerae bacterium]|nr:RHS repeat-associated core domain-containing protein [Phycisphaerae bacterium]